MGNSNHSPPRSGTAAIFSLDGPAKVWHAFLRDYMAGKPVTDFQRPSKGLVYQSIDNFSGGRPGPWTKQTVGEWFIAGTEPTSSNPVDPPGLIYTKQCGGYYVDPTKAEVPGAPATWLAADRNWAARAARGPGVGGAYGTSTAYFFLQSSWGGPIYAGTCATPSPSGGPTGSPGPSKPPKPSPTPAVTPHPTRPPRPTPTPVVTPKPTKKPKPSKSPKLPSPAALTISTPAADYGGGTVALVVGGTPVDRFTINLVLPSLAGTMPPAIMPEPVVAARVRIGRRRRRRGHPRRGTLGSRR